MNSIFKETDEQLLAECKMYDALQFLVNAQKNIATADYCRFFIEKLITHIESKQKDHYEGMQKILQKGEIYYFREEDGIDTSIQILGESIDSYFLLDKYIKDFMQYSRNAFDSISQFINKTILYSDPLDIEQVDFIRIYKRLKRDYAHTQIFDIVERIKSSDEFKYISEFNNKTKHISDTKMIITLDLLGIGVESKVTPFNKKGEDFGEKEMKNLIASLINFLDREFSILVDYIRTEIPENNIKDKRFHTVEFDVQIIKGDSQNSFVNVFIRAENIDELPEEIEFLFVKNHKLELKGRYEAKNLPYDEVFIKNSDDMYIGKFKTVAPYEEFKEIQYRKFSKQKFKNPKPYIRHESFSKFNMKIYPGYMFGKIVEA